MLPSCEKVAHPLNGCQTPWMWLQVAETWLLLKHCWKMISVINTSALSAVFVLVLLQLVWSILEPCSGWLFGSCRCCSSALAAAALWQAGQMETHMGAAVVCSGSPSVFWTIDYVLRDIQAALIGVFTAWVSASSRKIVWEGMLWLWESVGHNGCKPGLRCRVRCL